MKKRLLLVARLVALPLFLWGVHLCYGYAKTSANELNVLEQLSVVPGVAIARTLRHLSLSLAVFAILVVLAPNVFRAFQAGMQDVNRDVLEAQRQARAATTSRATGQGADASERRDA